MTPMKRESNKIRLELICETHVRTFELSTKSATDAFWQSYLVS